MGSNLAETSTLLKSVSTRRETQNSKTLNSKVYIFYILILRVKSRLKEEDKGKIKDKPGR